jgi:hypothetical protein
MLKHDEIEYQYVTKATGEKTAVVIPIGTLRGIEKACIGSSFEIRQMMLMCVCLTRPDAFVSFNSQVSHCLLAFIRAHNQVELL